MNRPADPEPDSLAHAFVDFAVRSGVLRFGRFQTKAGRTSPYFFNAGAFDDGAKLGRLAGFYAQRLTAAGVEFDVVFGPAYKGIALAAALAVESARAGRNVAYAYNRKEAKDHGEGGVLVGAPLAGRVLIVDDVISAGTSVRESLALIERSDARACALAIALDRQERATDDAGRELATSAVQEVGERHGLPVLAIATLADLLAWLERCGDATLAAHADAVQAYRDRYGV